MLNELIQSIGDSVPGELAGPLGGFFQYHKNKQFKKRIQQNEEKIKKIFAIIPQEEYEFFAEKIGTLVIQKIFLDEQDDKAEFFLLGFENCVENKLKSEDKVINYFDVISNLRMMDIKRLIYIYQFLEGSEPENIFEAEYRYQLRYVDAKLERLNLISKPIVEADDADTDLQGTAITQFGFEILGFLNYYQE